MKTMNFLKANRTLCVKTYWDNMSCLPCSNSVLEPQLSGFYGEDHSIDKPDITIVRRLRT